MLHMVSNTRVISESADGEIQAQAAFLLMQTLVEGPTTLHLAGAYYDRYTRQDGVLKLKERQVVYDTTILANDLVYPSRPVPPRQGGCASRRNTANRLGPRRPQGFVPRQHGGVLLPHVEEIGLVRADGAVAHAVRHHQRAKAVLHGVHHAGPHAAAGDRAGDQQRLHPRCDSQAARLVPKNAEGTVLRTTSSPEAGASCGTMALLWSASFKVSMPGT